MGVMEKMRNSTAAIFWLLIISFGLLWVLADTQVFDTISAGPRQLGEVNGDPITFEAYNARVSFYLDQYNQQTGSSVTEEVRAVYEEQAWNDLVRANLIQQKMDELGITVTNEELVNMIMGPNPDPFIRQQFADDNGNIDQVALRAAIEAPENSEIWLAIESQLREKRRQEKLTNYLAASNRVSRQDAIEAYTLANSFADIRYVRLPYAEVSEDQIAVSEEEIASYYRENKDLFAQEASFDLSYVSFPVRATAEDTTRTFDEIEALREEFSTTENDSLFLARVQSEIPFNSAYVAVEDLREEYELVTDLRVGEVSEVVALNGNPYLFKKTGQRRDEVQFAILTYSVVADPLTTVDVVAEQAADFHFYAETEGLEEEAARQGVEVLTSFYVKDSQFAPGIGQSVQLNSITAALDEGELSDVIELPGQFIVVRLDKSYPSGTRPLNEVRVQIQNRLRQEKRSDVAAERLTSALNAAGGDLDTVADQLETVVGEATNIRMDGSVITGLGREPILIGAIAEMEKGTRSDVLSGVGAAYVVEIMDKTTIDPTTISETELQQTRFRLQQERGLALSQVLFQELEKEAKIKDYRSLLLQ